MSGKLTIITGTNPGQNRNFMQKSIDDCNMENVIHIPYNRLMNGQVVMNGVQLEGLGGPLDPNNIIQFLKSSLVKRCKNIFIDNPEYELHSSYLFELSQRLLEMCNDDYNITIITYNEHLIRYLICASIFNGKEAENNLMRKMNYFIESDKLIICYEGGNLILNGNDINGVCVSWVKDLYCIIEK